ncbi:MAG TPA: FtsQ-type POTRA domain-containing protein [Fibrobacteraceae bacterium]|nr:FtsQ-type POTRA domain-containing protein [Fibrobacter sp.]HOG67894.1 FtsQ-type POTRA domain-containing protein [Fibrobacteraceae bacterium]
MTRDRTIFSRRRLGYNEVLRKERRQEKLKKSVGGSFKWFGQKGWIAALVLVVLGVALWQGRYYLKDFNPTEWRSLKTIQINGNRMLTWEEIIQISRIEVGMPMSDVNIDSIKKQLLTLPLVHSAVVSTSFPSTLEIVLEEATPLMVSFDKNKWKVFSERAKVLPTAILSAYQLPVVDLMDEEEMKQIGTFLSAMKAKDEFLYRKVSQIGVNKKEYAIEVFFKDVEFKTLFPLSGWEEKQFDQYKQLIQGFTSDLKTASIVDMRFNGFAYIKPYEKRYSDG